MAFVLSSLSGNLISAASAGFAPTNSADVSAIASAYQVVSATATQLNAGTSYLTSVNDTPISASRAGNAANASLANSAWYDGTGRLISALPDEATVSGIASAYAESAASSKKDASAMSAYALSADVSGVIDTVSSNSASWAGGITGDYLTAKVGSGQATFSTAFQDEMEKRPSLVIAAERSAGAKMYPRMMVTDWNDSTGDTHSGMLLANAFEFYICPKSARGQVDPSGVVQSRLDASQLQFNVDDAVSSFTRSSEFTRSGMRLGMSGNSASWVAISGNGTSGGFVTLDDGSGTSGRIVASSIPYWDGKLDGSASSSFYTTANESGYVDSAYVESQVSSKQDTLTFDWDSTSAISSINGSALAGQGGGGGGNEITAAYRLVTYDPELEVSSTSTATGTATGFGVIDQVNAVAHDTASHIYTVKLNDNTALRIAASQLVAGTWQTGGRGNATYPYYWLSFSPSYNAFPASACTGYLSPCQWATGAGIMLSAGYFRGMLKANELFLSRESVLDASITTSFQGWYIRSECHNNRGAHIGFTSTNRSGGQYTGSGSTSFNTASADIGTSGVYFSIYRQSGSAARAGVTTGGFTASSTNYTASSTAFMGLDRSYLRFSANDTSDTGTGSSQAYYGLSGITFEDSASTSTIEPSSIPYWNAKLDSAEMSAYVAKSAYDDLYSAFTALSGVISTYSGYFSSISSKVDNSAIGVIE